jgi:hypothetical protein
MKYRPNVRIHGESCRVQHPFHLIDCFADLTAWLAVLNLALQFSSPLRGGLALSPRIVGVGLL